MQVNLQLNIGGSFSSRAALLTPLERPAVGEEVIEPVPSSLEPVVQLAELARKENRRQPGERSNNDGEQERLASAAKKAINTEKSPQQLQQDQQVIAELSARDREVRAHEAAHAAVGGQYAGAPSYTFQRGPDGVSYAVGGEVSISTGGIANDPQATIAKAQRIKAAANAPADPSSQDRQVAAQAAQLEQQARAELVTLQVEGRKERSAEDAQARIADDEESQRFRGDSVAADQRQQDEDRRADNRLSDEAEAARIAEFSQRSVDLSQRLIDIGVNAPNVEPPGSFLDQIA